MAVPACPCISRALRRRIDVVGLQGANDVCAVKGVAKYSIASVRDPLGFPPPDLETRLMIDERD